MLTTACTAGHSAYRHSVQPTRSANSAGAAESTLAAFDIDPDRRSIVGLTRGTGRRAIRLPHYRGDYEIQFQCIGGGAAEYELYGVAQHWRCGQPILDEETASPDASTLLIIRASATQKWQVVIQEGHTSVE